MKLSIIIISIKTNYSNDLFWNYFFYASILMIDDEYDEYDNGRHLIYD